mgnify:CR=1 FL=1
MQQEINGQSDVHTAIASSLKKCLCDPMKKLKDDQTKDHKTIQAPVDKAFKTLSDARAAFR